SNTLNELGFYRQLRGGQTECFLRHGQRHAVHFEHDAAGMHADHPEFRSTLAGAHANFGGLARHRNVREHKDPETALTLHRTRDRTACGFDLARGDAFRLESLQAVSAVAEAEAALRRAVDAAFVRLAEFGAFGLKHFTPLSLCPLRLTFG